MKLKNKLEILIPTCIVFFLLVSIFSIFSAQSIVSNVYSNLYRKQISWFVIGILCYITCRFIKNQKLFQLSKYFYYISIFLLLLVLFVGKEVNSSRAWISLGIINIQPSEITKLSLILYLSNILNNYHFKNKKTKKDEVKLIGKIFTLVLIPSILTFIEPDTGSVIIYVIIALTMLFLSGLRMRWFILFFLFILIFTSGFIIFYVNYPEEFINVFGNSFFYRINRIIDWKSSTGMQLENSLISVGSAGLKGHGFFHNPLYFPEPYSDFIFSIYSTNYGFLGSLFLIIIFIVFNIKLVSIIINASNTIDKYLIGGFLSTLIYSQIQNIGMTLGLLPIIGIPLPFISYGGSSLIINMILSACTVNAIYPQKDFIIKKKKKHKIT